LQKFISFFQESWDLLRNFCLVHIDWKTRYVCWKKYSGNRLKWSGFCIWFTVEIYNYTYWNIPVFECPFFLGSGHLITDHLNTGQNELAN
jgi:hypothetical protein